MQYIYIYILSAVNLFHILKKYLMWRYLVGSINMVIIYSHSDRIYSQLKFFFQLKFC